MGKFSITFDDSTKEDVLGILGKKVRKDGIVVETKSPNISVRTFDGEEMHINEFGGVQKGSEVFIKKDIISLLRLTKRK